MDTSYNYEKVIVSSLLSLSFLLQERTKNAQFIIISLRSQMFELADRLVGIYKTYNATKSVTINPTKIIEDSRENNTTTTTSSQKSTPTANHTFVATPVVAESKA